MSYLMLGALDAFGVVMTVVGLGALIFFHELGHFLACRVTGTRVEAFSIGFGPELFGWTRGPTRYRVAAIPLGGYVKMAAENPGEARSDAPDEFPNKSFGQRLLIMVAGVAFNIVLAFALFAWAFGIGVPFERAEIGDVVRGAPGWEAGLRPGDLVTHVDGDPIRSFADLKTEVAFSGPDAVLNLTVQREGQVLEIPVAPRYSEADGMPAIRVLPAFDRAAVDVEADSPAGKAGGRAGDTVLSIQGEPVRLPSDIVAICGRLAGEAPPDATSLDLRVRVLRSEGGEETLQVTLPLEDRPQIGIQPLEGRVVKTLVQRTPAARLLQLGDEIVSVNGEGVVDLGLFREKAGGDRVRALVVRRLDKELRLEPDEAFTLAELAGAVSGEADLRVCRVVPRPRMPAERAGVETGDLVVAVGETQVDDWTQLQAVLASQELKPVTLTLERAGGERTTVQVEPARWPAAMGGRPLGYAYQLPFEVYEAESLLGAVSTGWQRTALFMRSVLLTIRSLVTRRVSAEHIGGPMMLASVTYRMFDLGWGRYLYILAIISVNLAILNMLPIPVLDGGQIVLLCAEKLRGKPLPDRVVGYYQMIGLAVLLGILVLAFSNDIRTLF